MGEIARDWFKSNKAFNWDYFQDLHINQESPKPPADPCSEIKSQLANANNTIASLNAEVGNKQTRITELESEIKNREAVIVTQRSDIEKLRDDHGVLFQISESQKIELDTVKLELEDARKKVTDVRELHKQIIVKSMEIAELRAQILELKKEKSTSDFLTFVRRLLNRIKL